MMNNCSLLDEDICCLECCWGQPSDPCQRGCLTSHACVMWGPRTLNADDDDDDDDELMMNKLLDEDICCLVNQTHHMQCSAEPRMFPSIDCRVFDHPKPKTMALSVLVVIEVCNALNRLDLTDHRASQLSLNSGKIMSLNFRHILEIQHS